MRFLAPDRLDCTLTLEARRTHRATSKDTHFPQHIGFCSSLNLRVSFFANASPSDDRAYGHAFSWGGSARADPAV